MITFVGKLSLNLVVLIHTNWTPVTVGTNRLEIGQIQKTYSITGCDLQALVGVEEMEILKTTTEGWLIRPNTNAPTMGFFTATNIFNIPSLTNYIGTDTTKILLNGTLTHPYAPHKN